MKPYPFDIFPLCRQEAQIQGEYYRISVLTAGLIRLEYDATGKFEDRATQSVINREFSLTPFTVIDQQDHLEIMTDKVHLVYDKKPFSKNGLSIQAMGDFSAHGSIWHYGEHFEDLGGTARTLDEADGAVTLERGIIGRQGFSLLDDSHSLLLTETGWVEPRNGSCNDIYFFGYGHDYLQALKDFYHLCGKAPMVPRYALGNWWSRYYKYTEASYLALMERFDRENLPFTVAVIDMDWHVTQVEPKYGNGWTGYSWNRDYFPDPARFLRRLHERGMQVTLNVHPADGVRAFEDAYVEMAKDLGIDYEKHLPIRFDVAQRRFMDAYFKHLHHPQEAIGVDFWWVDWQSGGISKIEGLDPLWMLNHYHYLDNRRDGKRPMAFSRYAGPGSHRYPIGFSGDSIVTWKSLAFQPFFTANASNIGYGMWSHDIGGHMRGFKDDEMAGRWVQFGVFAPIMRLHSSSSAFNAKEPWRYKMEVEKMMGGFLRLRHQMIPYMYTMNHRAYEQGIPLMLPMYYDYPQVQEAYEVPNQYAFGSEMIAAPVTTPRLDRLNVSKTTVWIPEGMYIDFFTNMIYRGGRKMNLYRDIQSIPVLAKAGAIIPMTDAIRAEEAGGNPASLHIRVFVGGDGCFTLYEDDNRTCGYENGDCAKTQMTLDWQENGVFTIHRSEGNLDLIPQVRHYRITVVGIRDCLAAASVDDRPVDIQKNYDPARNEMDLDLGLCPVTGEIKVIFEKAQLAQNHIDERCFAFLDQAEIEFELKDRLYQKVMQAVDMPQLLSQFLSMELEADLFGALCEICTASV